jgi:hypothetical protein
LMRADGMPPTSSTVIAQSGQCGEDLLFFEDAPDEAVNQDLLLRTRQAEVPFRSKNVAI